MSKKIPQYYFRNGGGHLKFVRSTHPTDLRMGRAKIKSEK